ncbi:hypothetical protein P9112_000989 [Eukaryota sp. TZLM1-RC]
MSQPPKPKPVEIGVKQSALLIQYADKNPHLKNTALASWAKETFNLPSKPHRTTIGKILKRRSQVLEQALALGKNLRPSAKRVRSVKHPDLDAALALFVASNSALMTITEDVILTKAEQLYEVLDIPKSDQLQHGDGWFESFKQRHGIKVLTPHGHTGSVDELAVDDFRRSLEPLLSQYKSEDIWNLDEAALFWRKNTSVKTHTTQSYVSGFKDSKQRITLVFCVNADGSEKMPLGIINKSQKPRGMKPNTANSLNLLWYANKKAWMTSSIFTDYCKKLNETMRANGRQILLLIDNAPSHILTENLSNVRTEFLLKNATSHIQPLDAAIIAVFKRF